MIKPHYLRSIGACAEDQEAEVKRIGGIRGVAPEAQPVKECSEFVPPLDIADEQRKWEEAERAA